VKRTVTMAMDVYNGSDGNSEVVTVSRCEEPGMKCRRLLNLLLVGLCTWGCSESTPRRDLQNSQGQGRETASLETPVATEPLASAAHVPFTVRTSLQGTIAAGRAHEVVIVVESRVAADQVTTTLRGVDGVEVIGGTQQTHGDQVRGARLERSIQVRLAVAVAGYVAIDLGWREGALMQSATVVLPVAAPQASYRLDSPGTLRDDGSGNKLVVMPASAPPASRRGAP
jgi:hypothetical protein